MGASLDLCVSCKACRSECPTGVDMARLKSEVLYQYQRQHGAKATTRMLAHVDRIADVGFLDLDLGAVLAGLIAEHRIALFVGRLVNLCRGTGQANRQQYQR